MGKRSALVARANDLTPLLEEAWIFRVSLHRLSTLSMLSAFDI